MVCALTEYAVAVTSAAANNVVANFCMLISDFDAKKNVCAGKRAQPISRAKQEQHHRAATSMLSLRPGNFAPIVGIAYAQRNGIKATDQRPWKKCSTCFEVICGQPEGYIASPAAADDLLSCRAWNQ